MVLSGADVEEFVETGLVVLRGGFPRDVAADGRRFVAALLDLQTEPEATEQATLEEIAARIDASGIPAKTWGQPLVHIQHGFACEPFPRVMNPRLRAGLEQLMGEGR